MIGIIGGSGFYSLLDERAKEKTVKTPYGSPSSPVTVGRIGKRDVAFLPRHGLNHEFPPHKIPYKANMWALKELGVTRVIAPAAAGSLKASIKPGDFVVPDQFVNFTHNREDTYYDGPETVHISSAEPYCPVLRKLLIDKATKLGLTVHPSGTVVVIQGPRFASKAESDFYMTQGDWDIINMTQYPECVLARELELCYASIAVVTDYDAGLKGDPTIKPVTAAEVGRVFSENNERLKQLIFNLVPGIPEERRTGCGCASALEGARF